MYSEEWEAAISRLLVAAMDTAEFAPGLPIGRSRQASIRRLQIAIADLQALERKNDTRPQIVPQGKKQVLHHPEPLSKRA